MKVVGLLICILTLVGASGIYLKLDRPILALIIAIIGLFIGGKLMKDS